MEVRLVTKVSLLCEINQGSVYHFPFGLPFPDVLLLSSLQKIQIEAGNRWQNQVNIMHVF